MKIEKWCAVNRMVINTSKSHYLVLNPSSSLSFNITMNQKPLQQRKTTKLLGLTFNDKLSWGNHLQTIETKVSSNLRLFYNIRHLINFNTAKQYYYNFIHSYMIYGLNLYYPLTPVSKTDTLYKLQKQGLRLICKDSVIPNTCKTLSTQLVTSMTNILPLPKLSQYFTCLSAHKILNNNCPTYLSLMFPSATHAHSTRHQHKLTSSSKHNALNLHILKTFNNLSPRLRSLPFSSFKRNLKSYLHQT